MIKKYSFMKNVVHIIPVGHTKVTLIEGMRQFPFHKMVLVLGKEIGPGEEKAKDVAKEIEKEFKGLVEIEYLRVDVDDVYATAIDIAKVIKSEQSRGNEIKVNASGSLRTVGISCYLACAVTGADLYVALPEYFDERVKGVRRVLDIPSFPLKEVGREEFTILRFLLKKGSTNSVDELIQGIIKISKSSPDYQKERARVSYHIKKLKEGGFIMTLKIGKNLKINLTKLGELYSIGRAD
jgi:DNA-binding transcriptional ArsR family regulator